MSLESRVYEGADIIDSRDVIARIQELQDERDMLGDDALVEWDEGDDGEELKRLKDLAEEGEDSLDWTHGETLIADHYFEQYAMDLAEDIGAIGKNMQWPANHIDWEAAADALKQDYFSVEYGDTTYWIRS